MNLTAIDLITTGPDEREDEIVAFSATKIRDGAVGETFAELADPGIPLPLAVAAQTGLEDSDLKGKRSPKAVLRDFHKFIGDDPLLLHDGARKASFLSMKLKGRLRNETMDLVQFARIVLPAMMNYGLETLARRLELKPRPAPCDSNLIAEVWLKLVEETGRISLAVVSQICRLMAKSDHPLYEVFEAAEKKILKSGFGAEKREMQDVFRDYGSLIFRKEERKPPENPGPLNVEEICALFSSDGLFSRTLPGYECRPEQIEMARHVCDAFNNASHLMIEAGTGTGKSIAYLVPSIYWAAQNGQTVIVSTNTKNLQAQLFFKDIPFLQETLKQGFKAAIIKGRRNYLCVRKFLYLMREADRELEADERMDLLPLVAWAELSDTGDVAEVTGFNAERSWRLWDMLSTSADECGGRKCRNFRNCFVRKARALCADADVVVANHSVVFAEMGMETAILPEYKHIIFDEAHNVENVATEWLGVRMERWRLLRILWRLHRERRDGTGKGLFTNIRFQMRKAGGKVPKPIADAVEKHIQEAIGGISDLPDIVDAFLLSTGRLFSGKRDEQEKVRYSSETKRPDLWDPIETEKKNLIIRLGQFVKRLLAILENLDEAAEQISYGNEFKRDLEVQVSLLHEIIQDVEFLFLANEENFVFWAEQEQRRGRDAQYVLCAAPLDISQMMAEHVYEKNNTVIFSSATLSVGDRFDFMMGRLGANAAEGRPFKTAGVGSSFDFDRQTRVMVPTFLPEPVREANFDAEFARLLNNLLRAAGGRALVLFTSYAMMNNVYPSVKEEMEAEGIVVLGHGKDGTRESLTATFKRDISSVLLGTQSFWEGVDVVGEALSLLVIAKLPFQVFTEPIVQARCEQVEARGLDSFMNYSLPSAVIRLKQGFGRLIRTRTDRGVVVIADKRCVTKRYGAAFLRSLPTSCKSYASEGAMLRDVAGFLKQDGASPRAD
ncbi:MAG: helicase C-terminal domain-containing protein [Planctomycetota bacterium]